MDLNYIDIIILVIISLFGLKGFRIGFIRSLFNLLKYIISLLICKIYYKPIIDYILNNQKIYVFFKNFIEDIFIKTINTNILAETATKVLIEIVVILGIFIISNIVFGLIINCIDSVFKFTPLKIINKSMGFIFGSVKGLIFLLLLLTIFHPFLVIFEEEKLIIDLNNSLLIKYLYMYNFVFKYFNNFIEIFNKYDITSML
ncbi:CvpA family protein [Tepidibacter formicigenes]|jgi:membrane protein required for colicin V production|uniref:Membrane protein required for colicin V production n=1 Tax=Tepidibacter formicigenes DSM 15518 TaxID=1123349 RepID=A0A1M6P973_9FIRM|nr:CvpA family protein [Tepidibacter formicigenes]SHK04505.1 membrane protein required for colicin V production [Tepidibacter formicigenes DSM 15518]